MAARLVRCTYVSVWSVSSTHSERERARERTRVLLAAAEKVFELSFRWLPACGWRHTMMTTRMRSKGSREGQKDAQHPELVARLDRSHAQSGSTRASYNFKVLPFVVTTPRETKRVVPLPSSGCQSCQPQTTNTGGIKNILTKIKFKTNCAALKNHSVRKNQVDSGGVGQRKRGRKGNEKRFCAEILLAIFFGAWPKQTADPTNTCGYCAS